MTPSPHVFVKWLPLLMCLSNGPPLLRVCQMAPSTHVFVKWLPLLTCLLKGSLSSRDCQMALSPHVLVKWLSLLMCLSNGSLSSRVCQMSPSPHVFVKWISPLTCLTIGSLLSSRVCPLSFLHNIYWNKNPLLQFPRRFKIILDLKNLIFILSVFEYCISFIYWKFKIHEIFTIFLTSLVKVKFIFSEIECDCCRVLKQNNPASSPSSA